MPGRKNTIKTIVYREVVLKMNRTKERESYTAVWLITSQMPHVPAVRITETKMKDGF